jgi:predicted GNAT superfamily acetyltransferase
MRTVQSVTLEGVKTAVDLPVAAASDLAARVAQEHGVTITAVEDAQTANAAADLLRDIWRTPNGWPLPPEVFLALGHTGNYVVAAYLDDVIVAASAGFRTGDAVPHLHSHITGVTEACRHRSVGYAIKLHQRAWALGQGITAISWTFDPLHKRNARFNLAKLGGQLVTYLPNFYGEMLDEVNRGTPSDRALIEWDLVREVPQRGADSAAARRRRRGSPRSPGRGRKPQRRSRSRRSRRGCLEG